MWWKQCHHDEKIPDIIWQGSRISKSRKYGCPYRHYIHIRFSACKNICSILHAHNLALLRKFGHIFPRSPSTSKAPFRYVFALVYGLTWFVRVFFKSSFELPRFIQCPGVDHSAQGYHPSIWNPCGTAAVLFSSSPIRCLLEAKSHSSRHECDMSVWRLSRSNRYGWLNSYFFSREEICLLFFLFFYISYPFTHLTVSNWWLGVKKLIISLFYIVVVTIHGFGPLSPHRFQV